MSGKGAKVDSPTPSPRSLAMKNVSTCTSVGTVTEPDCLGPCEPGTSVTLEGIVWQETEGGVLVVNVTWRGKTYVGTLLDCTKHDWAPPRFCESPTSDIELKANKVSRTKRNRSSAVDTSLDLRNVPSKLRNGKGRRTANSGFTVPASPVKSEASPTVNSKRKTRLDLEFSPISDSNKNAKKNRSQSRNTPTPGTPTSDSPSPQSSFNAWIECPEPNCNKKYKHISGLKYHQKAHRRTANDSSAEFYKPDADMMETESQRESVPTSDGEEAHQEDASVPPSPSFKFVLKSKLGVVDSSLPNSIEASIGSFEPDPSSSFENTSDGKDEPDSEENSEPSKNSNGLLFSSSHAHQSHGSGAISSTDSGVSQASTSGKVSTTSGNSSNHSATFLVPASSQISSIPPSSNAKISSSIASRAQEKSKTRGDKCYSGDKFYKVTPGPSGLSISVSPLLSNNNSSSPKRSSSTLDSSLSKSEKQLDPGNVKHKKHQKHKKKKKDKDKDRDRDREKEKKGSSSASPPGTNKSLSLCFNVRNSNEEESPDPVEKDVNSNSELPPSEGPAPSNNVPLDTVDVLKDKTSESPMDGSLEDSTAKRDTEILNRDPFESVQSPAYSDISDANDNEVEIKPVSNKDDISESSCVAAMDLPNFPRSSGFGMYPFFNQPSFVSSDQHSNQEPLEKTRISNQPSESSNQPISQNFYQQNQLQEQRKTPPSNSSLGATLVSQPPCSKTPSSLEIKRSEASLTNCASVTMEKSSSPTSDGISTESQTNHREVPSSQPNFPSQPPYQYSPYSFIQGLCMEPSYMHPMNVEQRYSKMGEDRLQREMGSKHLNNAAKTQSLAPKKPESPSEPSQQSSVSSKNVFSHFDPSTQRNSSSGSEKVFVDLNKEMTELPAGLASRFPSKMNLNISSQSHHGITRPGFSGLSFDNLFDKSKLEQKNFSSVDLEKIGNESQNKVSLTGPPPLRRDDLTPPRDSKADQIRNLSSVVDPSLAPKLSPICTQSSVMSSSSDPASSISSPKFSVNLPPIIPSSSSNHPISTNVKDSHRRDKNTDENDRKTKFKEEGVKPTMETTGPPPPPTNSYYLPPQYLQHSVHSFAHMPFEHGPSLFRPGHLSSPVLSNPYGPPSPYLHPSSLPQLRYHLGPSSSGPVDLPSRHPSSAPPPTDIGSKASEPPKSMDILQQVSQHYQSHHKIHELHDRAITSPSVPKSASPNISSNGPRGLPPLKTPASDDGPQIDGKSDLSRSPPPQRHLHTHHHTHVGYPGMPMYDPYRAIIASQHAATGINPFVPK